MKFNDKFYLCALKKSSKMKHFLVIVSLLIASLSNGQEPGVEKSIYGVQTGFLGIYGHNELGITRTIALRSELGFDSGIWGGSYYDKTGFIMTPVITLEPRFYYNFQKRAQKSKRTDKNTGNFISLKTSFHPDWFVISNYNGIRIISDISIVPTWGLRRHIGNYFNYEVGFGLGYRHIFAEKAGYLEDESEVAVNLHLRIGFTF